MFEALKKKLSGWLGTSEKKKDISKKSKKKKEKDSVEEKLRKKSDKIKKTAPLEYNPALQKYVPSEEEIKREREVTEEVVEDIKKEFGEEIKAVPQLDESDVKTGFFSKLFKKVSAGISSHKLSQEEFDEIFSDLEIILLENNVALEVVDKIKENLSKSIVGIELKKSEIQQKVIESLKESINSVLIEPPDLIQTIKDSKEPYVILFFGINGTGKTTSIAKLAYQLKQKGISSVLAAADTFRAASIEQLQTHGSKIGVPVIAQTYGSDPSAVAFDAISYAKRHNIKCVLIDTAGRMYTKANLLKEMEKIIRVSKPNLKLFVGESITGNDATEQARTFNESAGIDGIILSKADVDEKAGTILSVSYVTNKPIYFLGVGQKYEDLQVFKKSDVLSHLGLA